MALALASLNGGFGDAVLVLYLIGGAMLAISAAFPNQTSVQRFARIAIGVVIIGWAGYVLLFGGWIIISWYVALLPFILAIQGIVAAVRRSRPATPRAPITSGSPVPYQQFPPAGAGYAASAAPYPSFPQQPPTPGQVHPAQGYPTPGPAYPVPAQRGSYPVPGQPAYGAPAFTAPNGPTPAYPAPPQAAPTYGSPTYGTPRYGDSTQPGQPPYPAGQGGYPG